VAGSRWTPRCEAAAIRRCGHWATARQFRVRTAYPALAQHAVREARHLASNIRAALEGRVPAPFMFRSLGTMASLGHTRAVARVLGVRLTGFVAWWVRRTYYLFQMPRWDRRLRIVLDWTVAVFFRPDITRVDLRVEREQVKQARQLVEKSSETVRAMHT
jgi:NADH dehydrogenase FAD-containing subunit